MYVYMYIYIYIYIYIHIYIYISEYRTCKQIEQKITVTS